jgi:predicted DNA binding CopG/RHH family protein
MLQTDHKLTVRITEDEYRPVRVKAAALGVTVSSVVRELLARWANNEIEVAIEPPAEEKPQQ